MSFFKDFIKENKIENEFDLNKKEHIQQEEYIKYEVYKELKEENQKLNYRIKELEKELSLANESISYYKSKYPYKKKLSKEKVVEIEDLLKNTNMSYREISQKVNVSIKIISYIKNGKYK